MAENDYNNPLSILDNNVIASLDAHVYKLNTDGDVESMKITNSTTPI